jgi:hypothetical protein
MRCRLGGCFKMVGHLTQSVSSIVVTFRTFATTLRELVKLLPFCLPKSAIFLRLYRPVNLTAT